MKSAILAAARAELVERGVAQFSVPAVARRAGVQRTSVYRRYADPGALIAEAALALVDAEIPTPDSGSLSEDLETTLVTAAKFLRTPLGARLLEVAVAAGPTAVHHVRSYWRRRLVTLSEIVERGQRRGEWPAEADPLLLLSLLVGGLWFEIITRGAPPSRRRIRALVSVALGRPHV